MTASEQVPPDVWVRAQALHDAVNFHALRSLTGSPRLADVADTAYRMEHYTLTGVLPLEPEWTPELAGG